MKIRVLFFSVLRDYVKLREMVLEFNDSPLLADVVSKVYALFPELNELERRGIKIYALVNGEAKPMSYIVKPSDEVAFIPPVSGG